MSNDPPIEGLDYLGGVKVIDIGDLRVRRGLTRRPHSTCQHRVLHYDDRERRIWCADCETDVEPFDAFVMLVQNFEQAWRGLERRAAALKEAEQFQVRSLAAKEIDKAWRRHNTVPACPHCGNGLFPEDFKHGAHTVLGKDYAKAKLDKGRR